MKQAPGSIEDGASAAHRLMDRESVIGGVDIVGSLGVATELLERQGDIRPYYAWMGISTSERTYPDALVVEFAKWAAEHSDGFTLVVSDYLHRFNMIADGRLDLYDYMDESKKEVKNLVRNANKRVTRLRELFQREGIDAVVISWLDLISDIEYAVQPDEDTTYGWGLLRGNFAVNYGRQVMRHTFDQDQYQDKGLGKEVIGIHKKLAPFLVERSLQKGLNEHYINTWLSFYSEEEIFLSWLMATMGRGQIKIGPEWERAYDEITEKYIQRTEESDIKFGAVYLRRK